MREARYHSVPSGPEASFFGLGPGREDGASSPAHREPLVRVIDEDPDLASMQPGDLGSLILGGFVLVSVGIPRREHYELMGPGDLVSPWIVDDGTLSAAPVVAASALTPIRLAHLERSFALQIAQVPEIYAALIHRLTVRARRLSLQAAVNGIPKISERLAVTLWHLAERYGHVTPGGIRLALPITHAQLAGITASQRPSITSALKQLRAEGTVERKPDRSWFIRGDRPDALEQLARQAGLAG